MPGSRWLRPSSHLHRCRGWSERLPPRCSTRESRRSCPRNCWCLWSLKYLRMCLLCRQTFCWCLWSLKCLRMCLLCRQTFCWCLWSLKCLRMCLLCRQTFCWCLWSLKCLRMCLLCRQTFCLVSLEPEVSADVSALSSDFWVSLEPEVSADVSACRQTFCRSSPASEQRASELAWNLRGLRSALQSSS